MPTHATRYRSPVIEFALWIVWRIVYLIADTALAARRLGRRAVELGGDAVYGRDARRGAAIVDLLGWAAVLGALASLVLWWVVR